MVLHVWPAVHRAIFTLVQEPRVQVSAEFRLVQVPRHWPRLVGGFSWSVAQQGFGYEVTCHRSKARAASSIMSSLQAFLI